MTIVPRHALVVIALLATGLAACASRTTAPVAVPGAVIPGDTAGLRDSVVSSALALQGIPYRYGGSDLSGFDCSGLMQYVFARHGISLPRQTADQYDVGAPVNVRDVEPGDLVFFQTVSRGPSHVGLAIGNNQFVHAPTTGSVVRVEPLSAVYWARRVVGARRVAWPAEPAPMVVAELPTPTAGATDGLEPTTPPTTIALPVDSPGAAPLTLVSRPVPHPLPFPGADRRP